MKWLSKLDLSGIVEWRLFEIEFMSIDDFVSIFMNSLSFWFRFFFLYIFIFHYFLFFFLTLEVRNIVLCTDLNGTAKLKPTKEQKLIINWQEVFFISLLVEHF